MHARIRIKSGYTTTKNKAKPKSTPKRSDYTDKLQNSIRIDRTTNPSYIQSPYLERLTICNDRPQSEKPKKPRKFILK